MLPTALTGAVVGDSMYTQSGPHGARPLRPLCLPKLPSPCHFGLHPPAAPTQPARALC